MCRRWSFALVPLVVLLGGTASATPAEQCDPTGSGEDLRIAIHLVASGRICPEGYGSGSPCTGLDGVPGLNPGEMAQIATDDTLAYACSIPFERLAVTRQKPVTTRSFDGDLAQVRRIGQDIRVDGPMSALLIITWPDDESSPLHDHNGRVTLRRLNLQAEPQPPEEFGSWDGAPSGGMVETYLSPPRQNNGSHQFFNYQRADYLSAGGPTAWQVLIAEANDGGSVELSLRSPGVPPDPMDPLF